MEQQALWVDLQVRAAMERGEFDDLPGAGKPIRSCGDTHDPDWWVKKLIEREKITGVLPPALGAAQGGRRAATRCSTGEATADGVRRVVEDFNARDRRGAARSYRRAAGGHRRPATSTARSSAWRERRAERRARRRAGRRPTAPPPSGATAQKPAAGCGSVEALISVLAAR